MSRPRWPAAVALVALVLTGCGPAPTGQTEPSPSPSRSAGPEPSPSLPDLNQFSRPPTGAVDEDSGETLVPRPAPSWDSASRTAAVAAAIRVVRVFAGPHRDRATWWRQLQPLLTPQAAPEYAYVDPANVPTVAVTGPGRIVETTSAYVARVQVPSNRGTWSVLLSRADSAAPWLAGRILPPPGH